MPEFDATNGLLRGRNNQSHLGPATFPAAPNVQTHTLCFNKSLLHHRQHSTGCTLSVESGFRSSASEIHVSVQHPTLSSYTLCKCIVYCSCDNIKVRKPVGTGGCGQVTKRDGAKRERENKLRERTAKGMWQMTLLLSLSLSILLS